MSRSNIVRFFEGTCVLLTGATGFLGKLFLERLLRICRVRLVFVVLRCKKGVSDEDRLAAMFEQPVFDRVSKEVPDFRSRVVLIAGDCALPNLGVSELDWVRLLRDVDVVLHCAATVRFDQTLRMAYNVNVRATKDLLLKCTQMPQLKSVIYVSTAFTNCTRKVIGEEVYPPPVHHQQIAEILKAFADDDDDLVARITPGLLGEWPNTYTLTKCATEEMVHQMAMEARLPLAIVRPSIIISTYKDPMPGWIDNFYGPVGVTSGAAIGILRTLHCVPEHRADMVPADYVISAILAVAWRTARKQLGPHQIVVYNYAADELAIDWKRYMAKAERVGPSLMSMHTIWPLMLRLNRYAFVHRVSCFWLHTVPAYLVDAVARIIGKRPQMVEGYVKINKFINAIEFFTMREWRFDTERITQLWTELNDADHELFEFRMSTMDWDEFFPGYLQGGRVYLLKDPISTLPEALRRYRKIVVAYWSLKVLLFVGASWMLKLLWDLCC